MQVEHENRVAEGKRALKLSIILPVYNVEDYLERCLRSLEDQDLAMKEYEIIVVNDGSPDNSRQVVLRLMDEFANIVLIEQENRGVSLARNEGIIKAKGRYLLFVDPDDYVLPNGLKSIIEKADAHGSQVTFLAYRYLNANGKVMEEIRNETYADAVYSGIDAYAHSRGNGKTNDPDKSVAILFDREFMAAHDLRYVSQIPYLEDGEFIARVLCLAQRCVFMTNSFYVRTTRPGSATNSNLFSQDRAINGFIKASINLRDFRNNSAALTQDQRNFLNQPIIKFCLLAIQGCIGRKSLIAYVNLRNVLRRNNLVKLPLQTCFGDYMRYGRLYNLSVDLFAISWAFRNLKYSLVNQFTKLVN